MLSSLRSSLRTRGQVVSLAKFSARLPRLRQEPKVRKHFVLGAERFCVRWHESVRSPDAVRTALAVLCAGPLFFFFLGDGDLPEQNCFQSVVVSAFFQGLAVLLRRELHVLEH